MEENLNKIKKTGLNKTWLLVAGLVILTVVLLVVSLTSKNFPGLPGSSENEKVNSAHTSLAFSEEPRTSSVSGMYEVDLNIDTDDNNVQAAQLVLVYDPKVLTKVDIVSGDFLKDPTVISKKIDSTNGRITFAIANKAGEKAVKGTGVIARVSFSKLSQEETTISFLPHTQVFGGQSGSVLKETSSAIIGPLPSAPIR
ncbi:MAG: hypothetical protein HY426_00445 [Candidatus Levybacteria bacterium]|nr:hypothetical protein [Candidatus Levybacteria bacterium]